MILINIYIIIQFFFDQQNQFIKIQQKDIHSVLTSSKITFITSFLINTFAINFKLWKTDSLISFEYNLKAL